jgi:hypothetical protein
MISLTVPIFILIAVFLLGLLLWAVRPLPRKPLSQEAVLEVLSQERHCGRLPQILRALRPEDTQYLRERGYGDIVQNLRVARKKIALGYLDQLRTEYEDLLEVSRVLAVMSPELMPMQELERLKLSLRFAVLCAYLRLRLQLGLAPWMGFGMLSEMAVDMATRLTTATSRIGERAALAAKFPLTSGEEK